MKICYIAGPYRAKTKLGVVCNILRARKAAKEYWRNGYSTICPHLNSALMDGVAPAEIFLGGGLELLKHADLLVVLPGWERSIGTKMEIAMARKLEIKIVWPEGDAS